ncbi:MAG: CehA/McbA family metallohydrolase, partial [Candidatus Omnitrophica bacterium]|nr:CehA/McbA family metallohydrolase [Candidatus Omnitrophota bacterium]
MPDYMPISIAAHCNVDKRILGQDRDFPTGPKRYHGLPFEIGDGAGKVAGFGEGVRMEAVSIPVGKKVTHLVFAHRLIDSEVKEPGAAAGIPCAEYVVRYSDGGEERIPIRDRFEIAVIPSDWGLWPLLARPDDKSFLMPRYEGRWDEAGVRQTEARAGGANHFYLSYWANPLPERAVESVIIEPKGPRFILGGITASQANEPPFPLSAKRPTRITLLREDEANLPGPPTVDVDRGVATYPYPLSKAAPEQFLEDPMKGWGEEVNPHASPVYVEVAANPSATLTIRHGERELASVRWGEVEEHGKVEVDDRVRVELVDPGRNWVHTTVVDDSTGKPIPCRVHFRSLDGVPFAPHGHHPHVNSNNVTWHIDVGGDVRLGDLTYAYINGKCEGWLPRGEVIVDVARGYEYEPLRTKVRIDPGQQRLELRLKRIVDLNAERYFSGDTHVHFLSTQGAHLEAAGEGVNVVNLLQSQWGHLFTNTEEFIGEPTIGNRGETIVYATQENRQHILGHLTLLGVKEPIMPWCSGGPDEAEMGGNLEVTLSRWADACHAQGGTVVLPHIPTPNGEPAALIATGRVDAVEFLVYGRYMHNEYYRYLNCGYRLPLVGGTDKMDSGVPVGIYRTYVHIPEDQPFTYDAWCKALKGGNTFLSGGPLLRFKVEGQPIGSTIRLPKGGGHVEVEASAIGVLPFHGLEIVLNGEVVDRTEEAGGIRALSLKSRIQVSKHSWVAARCSGPGYQARQHHDS